MMRCDACGALVSNDYVALVDACSACKASPFPERSDVESRRFYESQSVQYLWEYRWRDALYANHNERTNFHTVTDVRDGSTVYSIPGASIRARTE